MAYYKKYRAIRKEVHGWLSSVVEQHLSANEDASDMEVDEADMHSEHALEASSRLSFPSLQEQGSCCHTDTELSSGEPTDSDAEPQELCRETQSSLPDDLTQWLVQYSITREAGNSLLKLLRKHGHPELPKDLRTLKKTPRTVNVTDVCGGQYTYIGMKKAMQMVAYSETSGESSHVEIQINVDGIPLFKSTSTQFWPILCSVNQSQPSLVALYMGTGKPHPLSNFMADFVSEMLEFQKNGIQIHSVVCDAPARAFLKNIRGHNSLHGCEHCLAVGVSVDRRTTFVSSDCFNAQRRTNADFCNLKYLGAHQIGPTPLSNLTDKCVDMFSLDYMHLVCLGVVRKMLNYWKNGDKLVKLSSRQILEISEQLIALRPYIPSEFARRPRSLSELDRWKATEYRQFLLYTGPVVLKSVLPSSLYKHFLCLSISISILLCEDVFRDGSFLDYAEKLLSHFVRNSERLYGQSFVVYNVHSLLHLTDDVRYFAKSLDELSAFKYENYLQKLKKMIRSASNPLVQVAKRTDEYEAAHLPSSANSSHLKIVAKGRDSTVMLKNGKFATVTEVRGDAYICEVYDRHCLQPFFSEPCSSDTVNIFFVKATRTTTVKDILLSQVKCKALKLPHRDGFVLLPLLHRES